MAHMGKSAHDARLVLGVVSRLKLFWGIPPAQIAEVVNHCWTIAARPGDVIARPDERLPGVFAMTYGVAKLALRGAEHEERVLRIVNAGQTFGEASALLGRTARYAALALSDCKLIVIPSESILALIDGDPRLGRNVVKVLAERNLELVEELEAATTRRGAQRLASYLHSLAQSAAGSGTVHLPVRKAVVAARLGLQKETLSRLLQQFSSAGLIAVSHRDIAILNAGRLTEIAG